MDGGCECEVKTSVECKMMTFGTIEECDFNNWIVEVGWYASANHV